MRQISVSLMVGLVLLWGCDRFRGGTDKAQKQEATTVEQIQMETEPVAIAPAPAPVPAPVAKSKPKKAVAPAAPIQYYDDEDALDKTWENYDDDYIIQAEEEFVIEEPVPKDRGKTYNELQKSDKLDSYPFVESNNGLNYNDRQISR